LCRASEAVSASEAISIEKCVPNVALMPSIIVPPPLAAKARDEQSSAFKASLPLPNIRLFDRCAAA
jgi:hypothetical protein